MLFGRLVLHHGSRMTKVALVIGGTGALGSRINDYLKLQGWQTLATSRQNPTMSSELPWDDVFSCSSAKLKSVDLIVNCASPNSQWAASRPADFLKWMSSHGNNLVRLRDFCGAPTAMSLSTIHVYGETCAGFVDEKSKLHPKSPYARGHAALETSLIPNGWRVMRLSNTFGLHGMSGHLDMNAITNDLTCQIANTRNSEVFADKKEGRDFLPVLTMLRLLRQVLDAEGQTGPFNLCTGRRISLEDWSQFIKSVSTEGVFGNVLYPESCQACGPLYSSSLGQPSVDVLTADAKAEILALIQHFRNTGERQL